MSKFKKFMCDIIGPVAGIVVTVIGFLILLFYLASNSQSKKPKIDNPVKIENVTKHLVGTKTQFSIDGYKFTVTNVCIDGKQILFVQQFGREYTVLNFNEPCK